MAHTDVVPGWQRTEDVPLADPARRRVWPSVAVIGVYLIVGVTAYWPVLPGIAGKLFSIDADFTQSVWFISWVPHALAHGLNPFFSNAMYVPDGVNLAQNTASPLLGLLTAPFAPVVSPLVIGNLLMVLAMPISATAAFVVLRKWRVWCPAAALGGLIYGFSPYMVGQAVGHVDLLFVPLPPFIALTVASILQGRGRPRRLGIQLGLLVVAQFLISPEVLVTVLIFTIAAIVCVAIRRPSAVPTMARAAAGPAIIALGLAIVLLAYPFWMMLAGPQHFTGRTWPITNPFHNDLFNFVVPGPLQKVSLGMRATGVRLMGGSNVTEADGYIGAPLLILAAVLAWRSRRRARSQLAVVLLVGSALLSLGPHLVVDGRLTQVPLPFLVLAHLPLLDNLLPSRISFEMDACLAAVIAFGLDDLRRLPAQSRTGGSPLRRWMQTRSAVLLAGLTLAVVVTTQFPVWSYATQPAAGLPATVRRAIPAGTPVAVTYPYTYFPFTQPMIWQAGDRFGFRILGGYARHVDVDGSGKGSTPIPMSPPELQQFLVRQEYLTDPILSPSPPRHTSSSPVTPELVAATRVALSRYDVRLIIVDRSAPGSGQVVALFDDALGPPRLSAGHFSLWANWHGG